MCGLKLTPSLYDKDPICNIVAEDADVLINIAASPYTFGKSERRKRLLANLVTRHNLPTIYVNQVGANDELIFDGASMIFDQVGDLLAKGSDFEEECIVFDSDDLFVEDAMNLFQSSMILLLHCLLAWKSLKLVIYLNYLKPLCLELAIMCKSVALKK